MALKQLSQAEYLATMICPMTELTNSSGPLIDIWPAAQELVERQLVPATVIKKRRLKGVYCNAAGTYAHVLLPTDHPKMVVCIVVNIAQKVTEGYYVWALHMKYGLAEGRMTELELLAGGGETAALQQIFASSYTQSEIDAALDCAVAYSQIETAEFLLSLGADLSGHGYNGVYYAVHNDEIAGLQFAIAKGVDINIENGMLLNTAIMTACNTKNTKIIKWLIGHGGNKNLITQRSVDHAMEWGTGDLKAFVSALEVTVTPPPTKRKRSPWWKFWQ